MFAKTLRFICNPAHLRVAALGLTALAGTYLLADATPMGDRPPAVMGALPGGPVFDPGRPKPPAGGNVLDPETLTTPPSDDFRMERRNNFYKKDNSDGLYRWAASGHWSNYDEAKTVGWQKTIPDPLKMNNGQMVKDADTWRNIRRPEIVKLFETYVYGKVPDTAPKVVWTSVKTTNADGSVTTVATGTFVNADGTPFVNPSGPARGRGGVARGPTTLPAGGGAFARGGAATQPGARGFARGAAATQPGAGGAFARGGARGGPGGGRGGAGGDLNVTYTVPANATGAVPLIQGGNAQQVLAMGFGTVNFGGNAPNVRSNPSSPDDWGAIRKLAWVTSRCIDFLETDKTVDAHQIAVIGGKQALMKGAMDERIALVAADVSGEMGASMSRHDWGETIDDVAQLSPENYCENFQKFVAHWDEMPTDAHMLLALMAPRAVLVTGGTTDQWSDPVGVFWSTYYASPVYKLLGKKGIDATEPPAPNTFIGEELVFYDHIGGHAVLPAEQAKYLEMMKTFLKVKPFEATK